MNTRSRGRWLVLLAVLLGVVIVVEIARRFLLSHSLYALNLRSTEQLTSLPPPQRGQKIVIFAPHPDDETLGCAGLIQQALRTGASVHLVVMTNGEFPEIDVVLFEEKIPINPKTYITLGYMRQRETLAAMRHLGLPAGQVSFLGYPNGYLFRMWQPTHWLPTNPVRSVRTKTTSSPYTNSMTRHAVYCGSSMLRDVETVLRREQPDVVISLHPNDIHVDHWPTGTVVQYALLELAAQGETFPRHCTYATYIIHRDGWPAPRGYHPTLRLNPPVKLARLRDTKWEALPLTLGQTIDKHNAIAKYRTQGGRFDQLLVSFARSNELFGVVPLRTWPPGAEIPPVEVIRDPSADLRSSMTYPHGDILSATLSRDGDRMAITVNTRATVSSGLTYHFALHAGGSNEVDRLIVQYDWQGEKVVGTILRDGSMKHLPAKRMRAASHGKQSSLFVPWPLGEKQSFFMVRAWTTKGRAFADQTATRTFIMKRATDQ